MDYDKFDPSSLGDAYSEIYEGRKEYPFNKVSRKDSNRETEPDTYSKDFKRHQAHTSMNALKGKGKDESAQKKMKDKMTKIRKDQESQAEKYRQSVKDGFTGASEKEKIANLEKRRKGIKTAQLQLKHQEEVDLGAAYSSMYEGKKEDHDKEVAKYREAAKKKVDTPVGDVGHDIHKRAVAQYNKQNPSKKV